MKNASNYHHFDPGDCKSLPISRFLFSNEFSHQLFLLFGDLLSSRRTVMAFSSPGFTRKGILFGENSLTKTRITVINQ